MTHLTKVSNLDCTYHTTTQSTGSCWTQNIRFFLSLFTASKRTNTIGPGSAPRICMSQSVQMKGNIPSWPQSRGTDFLKACVYFCITNESSVMHLKNVNSFCSSYTSSKIHHTIKIKNSKLCLFFFGHKWTIFGSPKKLSMNCSYFS